MLMSEVQEFILDMWIWNIDQKSYLYAKKKTHGYRLNLYKSELGNVYFGDFSIWSLKLWTWVRSLWVWVQTEENRRCSNKKRLHDDSVTRCWCEQLSLGVTGQWIGVEVNILTHEHLHVTNLIFFLRGCTKYIIKSESALKIILISYPTKLHEMTTAEKPEQVIFGGKS